MTLSLPALGLPLLTKELVEQAAHKRTYLLRVVYACCLFGSAFYQYQMGGSFNSPSRFAALGRGRELFDFLINFQYGGIFLFMPALTCGAIAQEKEQNTLGLLLITRLSPFTILWEKLLSRLIPMFTFLLLSMPLLAFTYAQGGVSQGEVWISLAALAANCFCVGTFALACSAYCGSTFSAFVLSYTLGPFLVYMCGCVTFGFVRGSNLAIAILPQLFLGFVFLGLAAGFLHDRAFVQPRNILLELFRKIDGFFNDMNVVTGGIVLIKDKSSLPGDHPLAWRETAVTEP